MRKMAISKPSLPVFLKSKTNQELMLQRMLITSVFQELGSYFQNEIHFWWSVNSLACFLQTYAIEKTGIQV